jgi:hypothetical protein
VFSGLPKLADKAFVIGFLVPAILAAFAILIGFQECPWVATSAKAMAGAADLGKLTLIASVIILAGLLLLLVNRPIYRILEGYVGPFTLQCFKDQATKRWDARNAILVELRKNTDRARDESAKEMARQAERIYLAKIRRRYPKARSNTLSTRFGNANRALETYAADVYDVEAILIWPRLSAIVPKSLQDKLTDARAQVNCFANITVLASVVCLIRLSAWAGEGIVRLLAGPTAGYGHFSVSSVALGSLGTLILVGAAWAAYEMAIEHVIALGDQVKVAFDLYLPQLPMRLGLEFPADAAGRKTFWAALEEAYNFQNPIEWTACAPPGPALGAEAIAAKLHEAIEVADEPTEPENTLEAKADDPGNDEEPYNPELHKGGIS